MEPEDDAPLGALGRPLGETAQDLDVLLDGLARGFEILVGDTREVLGIDDDVHVGHRFQIAEFA